MWDALNSNVRRLRSLSDLCATKGVSEYGVNVRIHQLILDLYTNLNIQIRTSIQIVKYDF